MNFIKIKAPTLKELFVKELETMILSGKLKIGEKIPSERVLAEQMQVSRAVVNSGIAELSRNGFLEVKPRSGVFVMDYRRYGTVDTLLSIMNYNGGHLREDEIRSILEVKLIIDRLAIELSIDRSTNKDILLLEDFLEKIKQLDAVEEIADAAFSFYHELAIISQNTLLPLIYRSFYVPVIHLWIRFINKYGSDSIYDNAHEILIALKERDKAKGTHFIEKAISASISGSHIIYDD